MGGSLYARIGFRVSVPAKPRKAAIGICLCITATAWIVPLPAAASAFSIQALQSGNHGTPNVFNPSSDSKSGPARGLVSPTLGIQPPGNSTPSGAPGGPPNAKPGNNAGLMGPESFPLSATTPSHFLSRDGRLEIDVPAGAVTASDVAADGGSTSLAVSQISPGSGSNAGGSGHFSFGTYLLQTLDANGNKAKQGLRVPVTLKLHVGSQGTAVDVSNSYLFVNGYGQGETGGLSGTTAALPTLSTTPVFDPTTQTIDAEAPLLFPSTSASFGTNTSSVATFGKPQPFEADLSGAALTASYPLDLPAGPKGITPPVVLAYNSAGVSDQHSAQGAAGWVGEGWNLSMGAISWAEHYVADAGGTAWQDSWQLSDPYGTGVDLIPPTTSTAIYQEDSGHAIATGPIQWQTNPEIYAKIYSYQSALAIAGNPTPPCWRVFLTNGLIEEFGCTADSLEYYPNSAGKAYIYSWLLDMIVEPDGNQIHVTYNRDMETLNGLSYPRDAVMNTVEWDSPTCSNTSTICTTTGTAPNLWAPLMRVFFSSSHGVVRSPSGSANCGAAVGNLRCDDPVDKTSSGGLGVPSVQSDFVLNDLYTQVCDVSCSTIPTWNTLKDYQLGYDQSGPGSIPIDPITGKLESTAGRLNLTQIKVVGDDGSTALPVINYTYTRAVEYYEDSLNFPAASPSSPVCSFSACPNGNGSTNCGPSFNTGYTPYNRGCVLWSESYDSNSYYLNSVSNGIGLAQSFSWVNLRSNLHGTDWWNGHNGGYWSHGYDPLWCNSNQSNIYPCDMADDGVWSRIGLASRTDNLVRLTQSGQGGTQTSTPVTGTTYYTYQDVFPDAVQLCPLSTSNGYPSACVAGFSWGSGYDNDFLDFYNGIFMGFTQVQITNPDGSVEAHKFYSAEGWGGWGPNNAQGGTVGLSITCPYSAQSNPPSVDTCWSDPYWDVANQANYPGQANALHGHEYEVDRYDTNGSTLLKQTKTQFSPICTPPIIPAGSPSVSGYTNNGWGGNLVSSLDLANPEVPCDVQVSQVDEYRYDGAAGTVPDLTTTYAYETGTRPCPTCFGRRIKATRTGNDGNINGNPVTIVNSTAYTWNDAVTTSSTGASGHYLINFVGFSDTEDSSGNKQQCTYVSYDGQANTLGPLASLTRGDVTRSSIYTDCTSLTTPNELATTSFYDSLGNRVAIRDPNTSSYGGSSPSTGCTTPSQGTTAYFTNCATFDSYFNALVTQRANALNQATSLAYQSPSTGDGSGGFGLWPMSNTDANHQATSYTYDALGRQTSITMPLETAGVTTQTTAYTVWCSGSAAQSPCAEIDKTQRLNSTQTVTTRTFYDGAGNVVEVRSPGPVGQDVVQFAFYDPSQRVVFESVAYLVAAYAGGAGASAYSIPDSTVAGTTYSYDGLGRTKSVKDPLSANSNIGYGVTCNAPGTGDSACYNQVLIDDPLSHRSGALRDAMGRILYEQKYTGNSTATWAVYATTKYQYDYIGDLLWILDPDGMNNTTTHYDMAARETYNFDGDVRSQNFYHDKNGNLTEMIDGRQSAAGTTFIGYDLLNRPIWRNTSNTPTGAYDTFSYDNQAGGNFGIGRLTSETFTASPANQLSGSETYVYDARGRQMSSTLVVGANSYLLQTAYDDAGNVLNQTYPTGEVVTNSLTAQDWLSAVSTTTGGTTLLSGATYSGTGGANGLIASASIAGGLYQYSAGFDARARATDITVKKGGTTLFDQVRTFDAAGNVSTANTTLPSGTDNQAFCYDEQNRVVAAASSGTVPCQTFVPGNLTPANYNQAFAFDNLGRLTNGPLGAYSYAGAFQPHGAYKIGTTFSAAYDGAGNMTCRAATSATTCQGTQTGAQLAYNNEGQLSNWQDKPGSPTTAAAFLYDGQGSRVAQQIVTGGTTETVVYVGNIEQVSYVVGGTSNGIPINGPIVRTTAAQTASQGKPNSIGCLAPPAPTMVSAIPGNRQAKVTWTPSAGGTCPAVSYTVTSSPGNSVTTIGGGSAAKATVTGLANGTSYTFTVFANDALGDTSAGVTSNAVTPTASVTPSITKVSGTQPTVVQTTTGTSIQTQWNTDEMRNAGDLLIASAESYNGTSLTIDSGWTQVAFVVQGSLRLGLWYRVATGADVAPTITSSGASAIEAAVSEWTGNDGAVPLQANTVGTKSASSGTSIALTMAAAPASSGGLSFSSYAEHLSAAANAYETAGGDWSQENLWPNGDTQHIGRDWRLNPVTSSADSETVTYTTTGTVNAIAGIIAFFKAASTGATAPGAPTNVTATGGNAQASVSWTVPSSNGGSAITSYTVTSAPGGLTASSTTTSATVTGLTNGTAYTFTVTATNSAGTGAASAASNSVTPAAPPGAPTNVTAIAGNGQATVTWTAPASNGGAAITSYTVTSSPGGLTATSTTTSATVAGLTNGTAYTFTVTATNSAGTGAASAASNSVTPAAPPGAPTNVTAIAGNGQATVTWTAPASNGGSTITGYTVTASPGGMTASVGGSTTSATVIGLANGSAYTFTVTATNSAGTSTASAPSNSVTPLGPPSAPNNVTASGGNAQATVSWTAPISNGGSAITGYTVTSSPGNLTASASGSSTSATVSGLTNGTAYTFTVTATNSVGTSAASAPSNSVTPAAPPGAPTNVSATGGNTQATVTWSAPTSNGGAAITSYTVTSSPGSLSATSTTTSATVTGLTNGTSYTFTVTATNSAGTGPASTASGAVVPAGPPSAPTNVSATAGNTQASVSWTAPTSNNGAAITSYTVTSTPGGLTATVNGSNTSATVTGLTNGTSYTFTVTATNSGGTSAASTASNSVTPAAPPGAPTAVAATGGMGQATVTWTAPASNGGAAITSYTVTSSPGGLTATSNTTSATVTGLTNGTTYTFAVTATNWAGTGPTSPPSNSVIPGITVRTYYYANGTRIATAVNGVFGYLASDGLGSADVTLDSTGNVIASALYAPFGGVRYATGIGSTDYGFTGQHADNTSGLNYFGSRYYDPLAGQFTSPDTVLPGDGFDIWGLSRYAYVEGNPIISIDPTGHKKCRVGSTNPDCDMYVGPGESTGSSSSTTSNSGPAPVVIDPNTDQCISNCDEINKIVDQRVAACHSITGFMNCHWVLSESCTIYGPGALGGICTPTLVVDRQAEEAKVIQQILAPLQSALPNIYKVLKALKETGQPPSGYRGGDTFANDGRGGAQTLPKTDAAGNPITYKEYDIHPSQPGVNRGAERIVTGSDGSVWYTDDHYATFIQVQ